MLRDERGATLIETTIVFPLVLILTFGLVEFGYAFYQYHTAEKATAIGARYVATRGPLLPALGDGSHDCVSANGAITPGTPCSDPAIPSAATTTCTSAGSGGCSAAVFAAMLAQMQQFAPFITAANVRVDVAQSKLGFIGRGRAVPLVTVRTTGLTYNFITLNSLLGLGPIAMPSFASTFVAEDQKEGPGI